MSNETDEIEMIFDEIRELSDELGLEPTPYGETDADEQMLSAILGAPSPQTGVGRRVVGGLAALAVAASVVTALAVGNGGSDRPDPDALSASLPAPSFGPDATTQSQLDTRYSRESASALKVLPEKLRVGLVASVDGLAASSGHILLVERGVVVRTIAGPDRTARQVNLLGEPGLELYPGLGFTGRLLYFAYARPGDTYLPIVAPYAETSPGVFVATAPHDGVVGRFTADQLARAIEQR